ncbi:DUF1566 domain-containing protein [Corticimicrobacter populi]|uniref:DUF1566 domain-containing protein n=1 Tax=Corticimicrobacter populi TaxID=2175229 RepID=A0A2V1K5T1_9BURK|nr:DUF1566 domain-containing protein [Corticimicrobacter populi]PWF25019.1 hypothetical protein DD235_02275 [Corticimicrobacter populi]
MTTNTIPAIGQHWPEQGGVYLGQRLIGNISHHIIVSPSIEHDIEDVEFSDIDQVVADAGEIYGHSDWRAPEQEDLMLAYVNAPALFVREGTGSIYWSRSEHHGWPWAVDFEGGDVGDSRRCNEFRVRPFRSFVA